MAKKTSRASQRRFDKIYPPELKADIVRRIRAGEITRIVAAREVGCAEKAIRNWLSAAGVDPKKVGQTVVRREPAPPPSRRAIGEARSTRYPPDMRATAVRRIKAGEATEHAIAKELGCSWNTVRGWLLADTRTASANGHSNRAPTRAAPLAVASDSIEDLVKALTAHQEAIKTIKAKLREKLG